MKQFIVCGIEPGTDWTYVHDLSLRYPGIVIPQYGLHPWRIEHYFNRIAATGLNNINSTSTSTNSSNSNSNKNSQYSFNCNNINNENFISLSVRSTWKSLLIDYLIKNPHAGVGECGIDKNIKNKVSIEKQIFIVNQHFEIAYEYQRSITLHCVGSWGHLLQIITDFWNNYFPKGYTKSIILHCINTISLEMLPAFLKLQKTFNNIYFSFTVKSTSLSEKEISILKSIPLSQLLFETDSPDQLPNNLKEIFISNQPGLLKHGCEICAKYLNLTLNELSSITCNNTKLAFNLVV